MTQLQIPPELQRLANDAAFRAWNSNDAMVPLLQVQTAAQGDPIAYGMPSGDVFPWCHQAATLAGVVRLFTREDVKAYIAAKAKQHAETPAGVADYLQGIVNQSQAEIEARNAYGPTGEVRAAAAKEQGILAQSRQKLLNLFRTP